MLDKRQYVYKKTAEGDLSLYATFPQGWGKDDRRPAVLFFFGGGWAQGTVEHFAGQAAYLAGRGMVAICADYRVKSRHNVRPDKCVEDAKSAVRWVRSSYARLGLDPERLVASGGSAGGHIAACAGVITGFDAPGDGLDISSVPNAMVLFNPVLDVPLDRPGILDRFGSIELAKALSPNRFVRPGLPPTLVSHGEADATVPFSQAQRFCDLMHGAGNRAELYAAPEQPHGFFNHSPWYERTLYRMDEFLRTLDYVQGDPTIVLP